MVRPPKMYLRNSQLTQRRSWLLKVSLSIKAGLEGHEGYDRHAGLHITPPQQPSLQQQFPSISPFHSLKSWQSGLESYACNL
jgi:hypothetical protein